MCFAHHLFCLSWVFQVMLCAEQPANRTAWSQKAWCGWLWLCLLSSPDHHMMNHIPAPSKTTHTLFLPWAEPCSMNGWRCRVDLFIHWSLCACLFPVPPLPFTSLPFGCNEDVESWSSSSVRRALVHVWCFFTVKQSCCSSSNFTVETTFLPSQLTDNSQVKILHWKQC